jgi:hypothetical protein
MELCVHGYLLLSEAGLKLISGIAAHYHLLVRYP